MTLPESIPLAQWHASGESELADAEMTSSVFPGIAHSPKGCRHRLSLVASLLLGLQVGLGLPESLFVLVLNYSC